MKIIEVNTSELEKHFVEMPLKLYQGDLSYIRPLDSDIHSVFNPEKNKSFENGECARWLLQNNEGVYIGRIAAFYNSKMMANYDQLAGACGFFECINNQKASTLLFDKAKSWLQSKGMEAMDGPVNFGDRDKWWGLLVDGFHEPCYQCNYNPPYYQELFENYGFQTYFKQYTYWRNVRDELDTNYADRAARILANRGYTFDHIYMNNLQKAAQDFRIVYNKGWAKHAGVAEITKDEADNLMKNMKAIVDPKLIWFAYYKNEPVGFFVAIPDVNQMIIKLVNGKLTMWGKLLFAWRKMRKQCKTMFGIVFGVVPEHQRKGVEIALIVAAKDTIQKEGMPYEELQMNWIGDFNPKMMRVAEQIGAKIYKTHHTYRYNFDREKQFERYPVL
jgi:GNAT superfamily N-acetyltransferase